MATHAMLSPSGADRWLTCPGSVYANAGAQDSKGSSYAEEGTAAHKLLELCLRIGCEPEELDGVDIHEEYKVNDDMIAAVAHAYDYITGWLVLHPKGKVHIERRVHWGGYSPLNLDIDTASGTADVILLDNLDLEVMDYKHGAGKVVEVVDNSQLKLYAVGALREYDVYKAKITTVKLLIVQPRARHTDGPIREWEVSVKDLAAWVRGTVLPATKLALKRNAVRVAGPHCRWCAAAPTCKALVDHVMEQAGTEFSVIDPVDPATLNDDELALAMNACDTIEAWIHAVRGRVLEHLMAGRPIEGWKLVRGRRTRQWDEEATTSIVQTCAGVDFTPAEFAPRQLLSPAQMEALFKKRKMGKAFADLLGEHIGYSQPGIHTAPTIDPRPEYTPGSEFGDLTE